MYNNVSEIDYTQPFESRGPLGMKFHYFLTVLAGINVFIYVLALLGSFSFGMTTVISYLVTLGINVLLFVLLLKKSRHIITYYKIAFWIGLVAGILFTLALTFLGTTIFALIGFEVGASFGALIFVSSGIGVAAGAFINHLIIKYYQKRIYLLN